MSKELSDEQYEALMATIRLAQPARHTSGNGPAWFVGIVMLLGVLAFGGWLAWDVYGNGTTDAATATAPAGRIGNQAPPSAVRRTIVDPAPAVQQGIDQYNAAQQAQFDAAVQVAPVALPQNSQGEPVISEAQQAQMAQSLQLAEQEGAAAADAQLRAQREAAYAEQAGRAPDVSKEDAERMMGRDLCHVPRADPHTCEQGLYKPTPVN